MKRGRAARTLSQAEVLGRERSGGAPLVIARTAARTRLRFTRPFTAERGARLSQLEARRGGAGR